MSKRPNITTEQYLINAEVPDQADSTTVVPHAAVIARTKEAFLKKGFTIEREFYRCNEGAQVAQGVYHLKYSDDADIDLLFAWVNAYDKSTRFKCSIGAYVRESQSSLIDLNPNLLSKRNIGSADEEVFDKIEEQIANAEIYFEGLVKDKNVMLTLVVPEELRAEFTGKIYFINDLLTGEQMSVVKSEFKKPSFITSGIENSVWAMYNAIIFSLQKSHPRNWMDQQRMIHYLLCKNHSIKTNSEPLATPIHEYNSQLDIEDVIKEVEQEEKLKEKAALAEELILEQPGHLLNEITLEDEPEQAPWHDEPAAVFEDAASLSLEVPEPVLDEPLEDDGSWPCLSCGEMQGAESVFHDGQLCDKCVNP